jgi:RNA polymerase sigma factor (sigma-70 family)
VALTREWEQELLEIVASGDSYAIETAFKHLYDACNARVYSLAVKMVGKDNAEDVAQEAWLKVYQKLHQFRGDSRLSTWIHRVTFNAAIDWMRKQEDFTSLDDYIERGGKQFQEYFGGNNYEECD